MANEHGRDRRIAEELRRILSEALRREVKDPRVRDVTITEVEVSRDLGQAKVYYSPLDPGADRDAVQEGLKRASGFLRSACAKRMSTRTVPKLHFHYDTALDQGDHMVRLLRGLEPGGSVDLSDDDDTDESGDDRG